MGREPYRSACIISIALFLAAPATAQTGGSIEGTVTDVSTGEPLLGVTVVATSPALQGEKRALSDGAGLYRFELLPPGRYRLTVRSFESSGEQAEPVEYQETERSEILVRTDKRTRVDIALVPDTVELEEELIPTGSPPVDVGSAETGTVVTREFLERVPMGRDYAAAALVTPGTNLDRYGVTFGGATSPENGYLIDGANVTDPLYGLQGSRLLSNFVEQVDVKAGSFMPEYGGASGGIVNVLTKSGSNEFHGSVFGNAQPGFLSPPFRPVGREAEAIVSRRDPSKEYRADFGLELGGPILKDRLWFHVGFARVVNHLVTERYYRRLLEGPSTPGQVARDARGFALGERIGRSGWFPACGDPALGLDCSGTEHQFTGKLTYLFDENHDLSVSFLAVPRSQEYLSDPNGLTSATLWSDSASSLDLSANYRGRFLDKRLIVEARAGWHHQGSRNDTRTIDGIDQRTTSTVRWNQPHNVTEFYSPADLGADVWAACQPTGGFDPCPVFGFVTGGRPYFYDEVTDRFSAKLSASGLFTALGHHRLGGGTELERATYDMSGGFGGGVELVEHVAEIEGTPRVTFGDRRGYGAVAPDGTIVFGPTSGKTISSRGAIFLQDGWSIFDTVTLNLGIRWEMQELTRAGRRGPAPISIRDMVAPRVQAIYDFTRRGRGAIKASWGRYFQALSLDLANRALGGATFVGGEREHCVNASPEVAGTPRTCPHLPGTAWSEGSDPFAIAPDLKGGYVDTFGGSVEYEFSPGLSVALSYEGRRLGRAIEDMSADGLEYFLANPGLSRPFVDANGTLRDPRGGWPKPERKYDGFTIELRKAFSKRWFGLASYTYSTLRGNHPGLVAETGQLNPSTLPEYNHPSLTTNRDGPLPGDVPHQFKLFGAHTFDLSERVRLQLGTGIRARSGTPVNYLGSDPYRIFILPRGSAGRTPWITNVDVRGALEIALSNRYVARFSVEIFNLLNWQEALTVDEQYTFDDVAPVAGGRCRAGNAVSSGNPVEAARADCPDLQNLRTVDGNAVTPNPNFGKPTSYSDPLSVRLGFSVSF